MLSTRTPCAPQAARSPTLSSGIGTAKDTPVSPSSLVLSKRKSDPSTHPRQPELADDAAPPAGLRAPVLDGRRPRVPPEGVELELRLEAHLRGERLVARDVEVRAAQDLVRVHAVARLDVAQHAGVRRHAARVRVERERGVESAERMGRPRWREDGRGGRGARRTPGIEREGVCDERF